jgi:hypothetical protein
MREAGCVFFAATVWMTRRFLGKTTPGGTELKQCALPVPVTKGGGRRPHTMRLPESS